MEAGEIDAVIDHAGSNVILLPAARLALCARASHANTLLAGLPHAERQHLLPGFEPVRLPFGEVLQEPAAPILHAYFPVDCVISLRTPVDARHALQVGLVGREGMLGVSLALETQASSVRALVQTGGNALRIRAERFHESLRHCPELTRALYRYVEVKLAAARQAAACNCFHTIERRLAGCLLMIGNRTQAKEFSLTQASLADALGVRRATINEAAGPLQRRMLISCVRGRIRVLDRRGLERAACDCYARVENPH